MTITTIKSILRATIFTGAIAALPVAALADTGTAPGGDEATEHVPDHAAAEARNAPDAIGTSGDGALDHTTAEARSVGDAVGSSGVETSAGVPDHAAAEARGAADQTRE
jgi:hypothetical protein